ncbi:hypothetical protein EXN66_Car007957 [Channa argus]|uniref:Uncharacterized protein n=1 Tax=Channa argus TaxID=215402 RepID=A0A6G1PPK6_CHAAH|nr:hypothetical protein EXN66_Car007957 [Channa argus]
MQVGKEELPNSELLVHGIKGNLLQSCQNLSCTKACQDIHALSELSILARETDNHSHRG